VQHLPPDACTNPKAFRSAMDAMYPDVQCVTLCQNVKKIRKTINERAKVHSIASSVFDLVDFGTLLSSAKTRFSLGLSV